MEEPQLPPPDDVQAAPVCASCGSPDVLHNYPTKLCPECRERFIKFPVPKWLWLFAGAIGLIVLFSLFTLPKNIATGVALEKGKKAEQDHRYMTAQKEFEKVVQKVPGYMEGNAHLMIAAFYNNDFDTFRKMGEKLGGHEMEDKPLADRINELMTKAEVFILSDTLKQVFIYYDSTIVTNSSIEIDQRA